jgi:hypothetical protein
MNRCLLVSFILKRSKTGAGGYSLVILPETNLFPVYLVILLLFGLFKLF